MTGLEMIETALLNDTLNEFDRMMQADDGHGWPAEAAIDALRGTYRSWIIDRVGAAIDLGCDLLKAEQSEGDRL